MQDSVPKHCKAIVYRTYFEPKSAQDLVSSVLQMEEHFPVPEVGNDQMLVRVHCCTVNPVDWKVVEGIFGRYIPSAVGGPPFSSSGTVPCADGSGVVVLSRSAKFPVGTEVVFDNGARFGALAEYSVVSAHECALKPKALSFADAAASVGLASGTAVMGCDYLLAHLAKKLPGASSFRILVLGGAGGVGVATIKYLKALGHTVFTTASARNVDFCKAAGADVVIDYTAQKWHEALPGPIEGIYQCVPSPDDLDWAEKVLKENSCFVSCASGKSGIAANVVAAIGIKISAPFHYYLFLNKPSTANLQRLSSLIDEGKMSPTAPGHLFSFAQAGEAFDLSRSNKATGKIVIQIQQ